MGVQRRGGEEVPSVFLMHVMCEAAEPLCDTAYPSPSMPVYDKPLFLHPLLCLLLYSLFFSLSSPVLLCSALLCSCSHVWLSFKFHLNTNVLKQSKAFEGSTVTNGQPNGKFTFTAKITPPVRCLYTTVLTLRVVMRL